MIDKCKNKLSNNIDKYIGYYIILTITCYLVFMVAPVVSAVAFTPLYSFQKYIGIIGVLIILIDFLVNKFKYDKIINICIYLLIFISLCVSFFTREYGIKDNLFSITWFIILSKLFATYFARVGVEVFKKNILKVYRFILSFWVITVLISIGSFLFNTGYYLLTSPYENSSLSRQGFLENRLFGIYMSMNNSTIITGILFLFGIYVFLKTKKNIYIYTNLLLMVHIILSGSRSVLVSLIVTIFIWSTSYFYLSKYNNEKMKIFRILKSLIFSFCLIFSFLIGEQILKYTLTQIPKATILKNNTEYYENLFLKSDKILLSKDKNLLNDDSNDILDRKDVNNTNVSNNRSTIWKDYIYLYKQIGLFGLSPNNYSKYIQDRNEDIYIVKHIKENYSNLYNEGKIYHPHNSFLFVYVATGIVGLISIIIFYLLLFKKIIIYIKNNNRNINNYLVYISIFIFINITMLFDINSFFVSNIVGCIFWLLVSIIIELSVKKNKEI